MKKLKLKAKLDNSELAQLEGMANYWDEIERRYSFDDSSFGQTYQRNQRDEILGNELRQVGQMLGVKILSIISDYVVLREFYESKSGCGCVPCETFTHKSDCAVHNMPAMANEACNCTL